MFMLYDHRCFDADIALSAAPVIRDEMGYMMQLPPAFEVTLYVFIFFFGACIFSFLNVVIYRLPRNEDFITGRSKCPGCGHVLSFFDMVPILSWVVLGRKCRYCGDKISARYPVTEALGGIAGVACFWAFGPHIYSLTAFAMCSVLTCVGYIDHDTMTIPDGINIAALITAIPAVFLTDKTAWYEHIAGFFIISAFMLVLSLAVPQAFGGGDIKLMACCGLFLGWKNAVFAFFVAVIAGGVIAAVKMIKKEKGKKDLMPFGPFICMGVAVAMFAGDAAVGLYMSLF